MKKYLIAAICAAIVGVMLCLGVSADTVASGTCGADGDNLTWVLDDCGTLTISGVGKMKDCASVNDKPWKTVSDSITRAVIGDGVTNIGTGAFNGCGNLVDVTIGSNVTSIGSNAFKSCGIVHMIIPEGVTSIGNASFRGCKSLTSVEISEGVTTIGENAFFGCSSLGSVAIPNSVTQIGGYAFYGCESLGSVTISSGVTQIGSYAFYGCKSLVDVKIYSRDADFGKNVFLSTNKDFIIYRYADSTAATYASENGHKFAELSENSPECIYGDASGDGKVDVDDVMQFARYIARWKDYGEDSVNLSVLDLNLDGEANPIDLIILTRHLADWVGYENLPYVQA